MTISEVPGAIRFEELRELIKVLPDSIHLTVIGGQALSFWVVYFQEVFPEEFQDPELRVGTTDIDFLSDKTSMQICAKAWGVDLRLPDPSTEVAAQIGLIELTIDGQEVIIDFLTNFVYPSQTRQKYLDCISLSDTKDINILGPKATLLSKVGNVLILRRHSENDLGQLRTAMRVLRCHIMEELQKGNVSNASQSIQFVLYLCTDRFIGNPLFSLGIDLLDILPSNLSKLDSRFLNKSLLPALAKIRAKRE